MSANANKKIGELLVQQKLISLTQLEKARAEQKNFGGRLGAALVKLGYVAERDLADFMSKQYQVPSIDLGSFEVDPELIKLIPREMCEKHLIFPVSRSGNTIVVAMADPSKIFVRDDLAFVTRMKVEVVVAVDTAIIEAIERYYSTKLKYENIMQELEQEHVKRKSAGQVGENTNIMGFDVGDGPNAEEAPVIKLVNLMLVEAIKTRSSDIHIETYEKGFRIRFRIDGSLYERMMPPQGMGPAIVSRIKIMSQLDISERRRPQDGRMKVRTKNGQVVDFRVSVCPTLFGEKIVLRILDKTALQLDMTRLGLEQDELDKLKDAIAQPFGMVLVTGPTGSGKTTTVYSALMELNKPDVNISTAEDPVEFNLDGINQVQMNPDIDLNFPSALRSFLRQDPDIIMVGEIRDYETAEIAIKAALTGHLVISTVHTNDAPSTVFRLLNMGVESFLVSSTINAVVAQRLVRRICKECTEPHNVDTQVLIAAGVPESEAETFQCMKGRGCPACNDIGFKGRVAIYEVLRFNDILKEGIVKNLSPIEFKKLAIEQGMRSLRTNALNKVRLGLTTFQEAMDTSIQD